MITEKEIEQAIKECLREPVTGNKRAVLADLIIIQDYLFGEPMQAQEAPTANANAILLSTDYGTGRNIC